MDKDGRPEEVLTLKTSVTPSKNGSNEPTGTESYANSDMASRTKNTYNITGMLESSDRYHTMPASGDGTRYTNYYRTAREYDSMGRLEYTIEDVADESSHDREQVRQFAYDFMGRRTQVKEGVSDDSHDISGGKPTMVTTAEYFHDDPDSDSTPERGGGDGNLHWVRQYYGTSSYNDTEYQYDWRNRRELTIPPLAPYTLVAHDNLDRVTAVGTYSATTNLDPGDDPATTENSNRLDLSKTYYDEWGRVYKTERYDDPADATPADALVTNTYYDRRGLVWAVDAPNTGIRFTEYDAAGRRTAASQGTQFDTAKYTSSAPDYPDGNEGIVQRMEYTLDAVGRVQKTITKELNHNDTDGMDTSDFIRTYSYSWYDAAHRMTDSVNYGTNNSDGWKDNSTAPTYGASAPSRSDTVLVTTYTYDAEGRRTTVTDPRNLATLSVYDKLGRSTSKEEADGSADERITNYEYNGLNSLTKITADLTTDQQTQYVYEDGQNARWVTKIHYPATDTDNGKTLGEPSEETYDTITFTYNADGTLSTRTDQNGTVLTWDYDALRRKTEEEVTTVGTDVDGTIRALTWTYTSDGLVEYITSHTDTTPDTSTWTDAANQIKYTYNAADKLIKEEQEVDGAVDGSTLAVEYSYGTDYSTGNYNRLNYTEYPDSRKIWLGYTHSDTSNTFQDTINDTFSRPGQIARDNSSSIGDLLAEYDFNGTGRMVRRVHDEDTGAYGNDTRMDLWHGTSGDYDGLDRFGRIVDMKHTDLSTSTDFFRRSYTYDRDSNRTSITHALHKADSEEFTYDDLNRLKISQRGILDSSNAVTRSDVGEAFHMDLLGNFSETQGIRINGSSSTTIKHTVNATNEITTLDRPNPSDAAKAIDDDFTSLSSDVWTQDLGTWSISSGQANIDTLSSSNAKLLANADLDYGAMEVKITFPASSSTKRAAIIFSDDGSDNYYAATLDRRNGLVALYPISSGTWGSALGSASATYADSTQYTLRVFRNQKHIYVEKVGESGANFTVDSSSDFGTGSVGLYANMTGFTFDDFSFARGEDYATVVPRWRGTGAVSLDTGNGELNVQGNSRGGEVFLEGFAGDNYMVEYDNNINTGNDAVLLLRYVDPNNHYRVQFNPTTVVLSSVIDGKHTTLATASHFSSGWVTMKVKASSSDIKVWVAGTLKITKTTSDITSGGVGLTGENPKFKNITVGYDTDADDAIDSAVYADDFTTTQVSFSHDSNGNLTDSGTFKLVYDAWNRLVQTTTQEDGLTIGQYEFDAKGRRLKKVIDNAGDFDGTTVYLYDGWKIIETRDGSSNVQQQFIHGTQYIDELVMMRLTDQGDLYVHQDANWNVIGLTDLGGSVVERYLYTPYGEPVVQQETSYGDRDGDAVVDSTDKGTPGSTCTGTVTGACRILDLDFDGDYDSSDATLFDSLTQGDARHPGRTSTAVRQPFGHQGLLYDAEIASYQNRHRQYDPSQRRFLQRDPLGFQSGVFHAQAHYRDGMNMLGYVRNNAVTFNDPQGTEIIAEMWDIIDSAASVGIGIGIEVITSLPIGIIYGPAFSHCLSHCLITRFAGADASHVVGNITEQAQVLVCQNFGGPVGTCRSADQQTDYWDNALGRVQGWKSCGTCYHNCKAAMGNTTFHQEGPSFNRPYGPYGNPPQGFPTYPWLPPPPGWGP